MSGWPKHLAAAGIVACIPVGLCVLMALQNGTHAHYCPAASAWGPMRCLPTFEGIRAALYVWGLFLPLAWLLVLPFNALLKRRPHALTSFVGCSGAAPVY